MVSPEGIGTQPDRPKSGRGILLAIAALVIAAGFAVLGALSPAEELAVETTTTTTATTTTVIEAPLDLDNFDVGQIVTGEPLELVRAPVIGNGYPLALVQHDGADYLFTVDSVPWPEQPGGLWALRSQDGVHWTDLGQVVGPDFQVSNVTSNGGDLVALVSSKGDGSLSIFRSDDGVGWDISPIDTGPQELHAEAFATAIGSSEGITVVATMIGPDVEGLIAEAMEGTDFEVSLGKWGWSVDTDAAGEPTIAVYGPLGLRLTEIPLAGLDLTEEERQLIVDGYHMNPETVVWVSTNGSEWQRSAVEGVDWIQGIFPSSSRGLILAGTGNTGPRLMVSNDGQTWDTLDSTGGVPWNIYQWGDRLVGHRDMSVPELMISEDGETWASAGLAEQFPTAIQWSTYPTAAGPGGVALLVSGFGDGIPIRTQEPTTLTTDKGHTVSFDPMNGSLEIEAGDISYTWHAYGNTQPEDLLIDLAAETIELLDSESGISFGTVSFDEVQQAEEDFYGIQYRGDGHRALVFTSDAENWTIQDLADSIGPEAVISNLMVGSDRLVTVVLPEGDWYYPSVDPGFEIWTAPLP